MLHPTVAATLLLVWGAVVHLVCDWLLQNDYMARNKDRLGGTASLLHAAIHAAGLLLFFPFWAALSLGIVHALIDQRVAVQAWGRLIRQTNAPGNPVTLHLAIWRDQTVHLLVLAVYAYFLGR